MAEPKRFHFDSEQRSVGAPGARRRTWLWIAVSLALHGALILFVLAGAARGGHTELAGVLEVAVVGPMSAGDPESRAREGEIDPSTPDAVRRPEAPPEDAAKPETPPRPNPIPAADAPPPATPPVPPIETASPRTAEPPVAPPSPRPPEQARATDAAPAAPTQPQAKDMPRPPSAEAPDTLAPPRRPDQAEAAPAEPQPPKTETAPARPATAEAATPPAPPRPPEQAAAAPAEPQPPKAETASIRPPAPPKETAPAIPPRPKAAREPTAKPNLAAPPRQGRRDAPPGQTASLGSPNGGDRLGRSENDDTGGLINVNLNPRFRVPPPPPHYPRLSIERDEEGVVVVRALVDPTGAPQRVIVWKSSGYALLDEAALKAVQGWRFEPMVREGRATVSWVQVPVRFRLN